MCPIEYILHLYIFIQFKSHCHLSNTFFYRCHNVSQTKFQWKRFNPTHLDITPTHHKKIFPFAFQCALHDEEHAQIKRKLVAAERQTLSL